MTDPIQATSRIPVPPNQTIMGANDPNVSNSNRSTENQNNTVSTRNEDTNRTAFQNYLNQQAITNEERARRSFEFDPAKDIINNSAYSPAGRSSPT